MLKFLYSTVVLLIVVFIVPLAYFLYPLYRPRLRERFGFIPPPPAGKTLWIHAASVGEVRAIVPMISQLTKASNTNPVRIVLSTITPASASLVDKLLASQVTHFYLPLDLPFLLNRFIRTINPCQLILVETEIWPNLLAACRHNRVPVAIVNARLSLKRHKLYLWARQLIQPLLQDLCAVIAQSKEDAQRFEDLGVKKNQLHATGNLKFDQHLIAPSHDLGNIREALKDTLVFMAASTHEGEEIFIIETFALLRRKYPELVLLIAPRNINRVADIQQMLREHNIEYRCRTDKSSLKNNEVAYIVDTLGELISFYEFAKVVFMGGSLVPVGGHNPIEPALVKKPILSGTHIDNFRDVYRLMQEHHAVTMVDATNLLVSLDKLLGDSVLRQHLAENAYSVVTQQRGATAKTLAILRDKCNLLQ